MRSPGIAGMASLADRIGALQGLRRAGLAVLAGAVSSLAMPPLGAFPILAITFPVLVWLVDGAKTKRTAFFDGWWFAFGFHVLGLYWIAFALEVVIDRLWWMVPLAVAGLPALLAIFAGTATLAHRLFAPRAGVASAVLLAVLWWIAEWLRGNLFTGFPWNLLGYSWTSHLVVAQGAALIGIYGLGLLTVLAATAPAALSRSARGGAAMILVTFAAIGGLAAWGSGRLPAGPAATVDGVRFRIVQPATPQATKIRSDRAVDNFLDHVALAGSPGFEAVSHVVWPETAVTFDLARSPQALAAIAEVTPPGGYTLLGAIRVSPDDQPLQIWNSLMAIDPEGRIEASYDKHHLVPFGEYVPLRGWLPIERVVPGRIDFSAGPGPRTLSLQGLPSFSPLVCYEAIFPGEVAAADDAGRRPQFLLNVTNDGWYGITAGPHQHFAIARMRAIEEGIPLVRAANTGISGVVDPWGRVVASLGLGERGVVDSPLPETLEGPPPYSTAGDSPASVLATVLLVLVAVIGRRRA